MFGSLFLGICAATLCANKAENVDMCVGDVCARVLGQSGKIDVDYDDQTIQVTMDSITEVDSDGNAVGNTGSVNHSFNSFASQDFELGKLYNTSYQNVSATAINFTASLVDATSTFKVQLYLFTEDGSINNQNESYDVSRGSFKCSYNWDYWPFCTIGGSGVTKCTKGGSDQEGAYLDFKIILKGNNEAEEGTNGTLVYEDDTRVFMPADYYASGWEVMPDGYPQEVLQGSKTEVAFRFARFDAALDYDPILNWGTGAVDDDNSAFSLISGPVVAITVISSAIIGLALSL
jgi:hypothetical protein